MKPIDIDIIELIPQRPPFLLIDKLVDVQESQATTLFTVTADNPMVNEGKLAAAGMMENIAQSCAALTGYHTIMNGLKIRLGVIGAVRGMSINRQPLVGETLTTTIYKRDEVFGMTIVDAEIYCNNELLGVASMKIALIDKVA